MPPSSNEAAWLAACEAYHQYKLMHKLPSLPAAFANFGLLHIAVTEALWDRRGEIAQKKTKPVMHVVSSAGLVAAFSPAQRMVQLRDSGTALDRMDRLSGLIVRSMPASAKLLEGEAAKEFSEVPLILLLWHFGQAAEHALEHMPSLHKKRLFLRRFPSVEPGILQMRHLRLIHTLSRDPLSFDSLLPMMKEADRHFVCPDLTSLYLTGALQLKSSS